VCCAQVEDIAHWFPAVGSVPPGARRCVLKAVAGGAVDDAMDGEGAEGDAAADSGAGAGGGRQIAPTAAAAASAVKEPTSGYECRYLHAVVSSRDGAACLSCSALRSRVWRCGLHALVVVAVVQNTCRCWWRSLRTTPRRSRAFVCAVSAARRAR
jgi:hypothetical protein